MLLKNWDGSDNWILIFLVNGFMIENKTYLINLFLFLQLLRFIKATIPINISTIIDMVSKWFKYIRFLRKDFMNYCIQVFNSFGEKLLSIGVMLGKALFFPLAWVKGRSHRTVYIEFKELSTSFNSSL